MTMFYAVKIHTTNKDTAEELVQYAQDQGATWTDIEEIQE